MPRRILLAAPEALPERRGCYGSRGMRPADDSTGKRLDAAILVVLALALLAAVGAWSVDLPHFDEWVVAGDLDVGGFAQLLDRVWTPHNEHRLLVPRLVLAGLARVTAWNVRVETLLSALCAIAIAGLVWRLGRSFGTPLARTAFRGSGALLVLGWQQVENLIWGWQIAVFLCVLAAVGAIVLLTTPRGTRGPGLAGAIALGLLSSFSYGAGLAVWPAGAVALAVDCLPSRRRPGARLALALWGGAGAATVAAYVVGLPARSAPLGAELVLHGLAVLSSPLMRAWPSVPAAATVSVAALALAVGGLWRRREELRGEGTSGLERWLGLLLFGLGVAGMTALGRADHGPGQGLASRYTTLAAVFWVGLVGLWLERGRSRSGLAIALVVSAGTIAGSVGSVDSFQGQHRQRSRARAYLQRGVVLAELAPRMAGTLERLELAASIACRRRTSVFRADRGRPLECRLEVWPEAVDGQRSLPERKFDLEEGGAGLRAVETGFSIPVESDAVEGSWTLERDDPDRRCLRGWAADARGLPVAEVIVAEGTSARRVLFRRRAVQVGTTPSGGEAPKEAFFGLRACWIPEPGNRTAPITVYATVDQGATGPLPRRAP